MTILSYSPLESAFNLTSASISAQYADVKKINDSVIDKVNNIQQPVEQPIQKPVQQPVQQPLENNNDYESMFLQVIKNPDFDKLFMKYIDLIKPDFNSMKYTNGFNIPKSNIPNIPQKEAFGNNKNVLTRTQKYIIFFVVSFFVYILFSILFK